MLFDIAEFLVFLPIVFGLCWFATHRHLRGVGAELYSEWLAGEVTARDVTESFRARRARWRPCSTEQPPRWPPR